MQVTMLDKDTVKRLEAKLDRLLQMAPTVEMLGRLVLRRSKVTDVIPAPTLDGNTKITRYREVGHKRVFVELGEIALIPQRKRKPRVR